MARPGHFQAPRSDYCFYSVQPRRPGLVRTHWRSNRPIRLTKPSTASHVSRGLKLPEWLDVGWGGTVVVGAGAGVAMVVVVRCGWVVAVVLDVARRVVVVFGGAVVVVVEGAVVVVGGRVVVVLDEVTVTCASARQTGAPSTANVTAITTIQRIRRQSALPDDDQADMASADYPVHAHSNGGVMDGVVRSGPSRFEKVD